MVIGGETLYRALLPQADRIYLTRVHVEVPDGDAHFPDPDPRAWELTCSQPLAGEGDQPDCTFTEWQRIGGR